MRQHGLQLNLAESTLVVDIFFFCRASLLCLCIFFWNFGIPPDTLRHQYGGTRSRISAGKAPPAVSFGSKKKIKRERKKKPLLRFALLPVSFKAWRWKFEQKKKPSPYFASILPKVSRRHGPSLSLSLFIEVLLRCNRVSLRFLLDIFFSASKVLQRLRIHQWPRFRSERTLQQKNKTEREIQQKRRRHSPGGWRHRRPVWLVRGWASRRKILVISIAALSFKCGGDNGRDDTFENGRHTKKPK